jgi:ATP-dependent Clp protease protease subunit
MVNGILAKHTGKALDVITKDTDRDFFMSAEQSKEYGIVDEVLSGPRKEAKKKNG